MSAHGTKHTTKLVRLAVGAGACLAGLTLAVPATAGVPPEPPDTPTVVYVDRNVPIDDGFEATSVAAGALGGIALAGVGLAITLGVQRRRDHHTALHPA
ncbi:hypothetical protein ACGFIF_28865 [Kribbella sp. NPDC049174]|uniref:hypothetical protein n=1 Tax=Kribbella sp. NPDC049174 TaxID=3364112 RepID=UPI00371431DE